MGLNSRVRHFLGLGIVLSLVNCAEITDFAEYPPSLSMDLGQPPPPKITHVAVTNGAGTQLLAGEPDSFGDVSSNPDLAALDGELTVVATWTGGGTTTQTLTHAPNSRVKLVYDRELRTFVTAASAAKTVPGEDKKRGDAGD